jgi:hypothetical protein
LFFDEMDGKHGQMTAPGVVTFHHGGQLSQQMQVGRPTAAAAAAADDDDTTAACLCVNTVCLCVNTTAAFCFQFEWWEAVQHAGLCDKAALLQGLQQVEDGDVCVDWLTTSASDLPTLPGELLGFI